MKRLGPVDYSAATPPDYTCSRCGAHGVKLWRQYNTFASHIELMCGECALADQHENGPIDDDGTRAFVGVRRIDQIGWMVPAIPTAEGDTYWGYSSVPTAGREWWRRLPTRPSLPESEPSRRD